MSNTATTKDTAYAELLRHSLRAEASKVPQPLSNLQAKLSQAYTEKSSDFETDFLCGWYSPSASFASPIEALRYRDKTALSALFEQNDLEVIILDVVTYLFWLWPEPCWEDDPYEFLQEFL